MRTLQGIIVSNKMRGTAVVRVDRLVRHPKYQKYVRVSRAFKADTAGKEYQAGDVVLMRETRPLSREKRWRIAELVKRVATEAPETEDEVSNS